MLIRRRVMMLMLVFLLYISIGNISYATEVSHENVATVLKEIGIFNRTENGFELEEPCDRLFGAVILVKFLGKENDALSQENIHPFDDVRMTYVDKYVGFLYSEGLVKGKSENSYGRNAMTANEFAAVMLKALGYEENVDFTWNKALSSMSSLNIISSEEAANLGSKKFIRDDAVFLCYKTLLAKLKDSDNTLANKLLWQDVFTTDQLGNTLDGKLMLAADMPDLIPNYTVVYNAKDLKDLIILSMKNDQLGLGIKAPGMIKEELLSVYNDIILQYHCKAVLYPSVGDCWDGYIYPHIGLSDYLMMEFYYENPSRYAKSWKFYRTDLIDSTDEYHCLSEWAKKVDYIVAHNTSSTMSESEKVKALHDYLVLNTKYSGEYEGGAYMTPHFAEEVIFEGQGVCDSYAEAFKILMNGAGIECKVIYGDTPYGLHAWNQVKIDNEWYNIDVTWDDPNLSNRIYYDYYCTPDSVFVLTHIPEPISHAQKCTSLKYYSK